MIKLILFGNQVEEKWAVNVQRSGHGLACLEIFR